MPEVGHFKSSSTYCSHNSVFLNIEGRKKWTQRKIQMDFIQLFYVGKKVWTTKKERKKRLNKRVQILKQRNVALIISLIQTS